MVNIAQDNTNNQTTDILVEDQLQPPWTWSQFPRSENSTNQTAEQSTAHSFIVHMSKLMTKLLLSDNNR